MNSKTMEKDKGKDALEKKYYNLKTDEEQLEKQIKDLEEKHHNKNFVDKQTYMKLLHEYNDIKDAAQIMIGALANIKGETIAAIHKQFNLPTSD